MLQGSLAWSQPHGAGRSTNVAPGGGQHHMYMCNVWQSNLTRSGNVEQHADTVYVDRYCRDKFWIWHSCLARYTSLAGIGNVPSCPEGQSARRPVPLTFLFVIFRAVCGRPSCHILQALASFSSFVLLVRDCPMSTDSCDHRRIGDEQTHCRCHISHAVGSSAFTYIVPMTTVVWLHRFEYSTYSVCGPRPCPGPPSRLRRPQARRWPACATWSSRHHTIMPWARMHGLFVCARACASVFARESLPEEMFAFCLRTAVLW